MPKKSKLMRRVEDLYGEPLEELLPRVLTELGHRRAAEYLGVAQGNLSVWCLKLGIEHVSLYLKPGQLYKIIEPKEAVDDIR